MPSESGTRRRVKLVPLRLTEANEIVRKWHRHHKPVVGALFAVGVADVDTGEKLGCAIVGRPVARMEDDGLTVEVTRVSVAENVENACSMLYGACNRAARALGYTRVITRTLVSESGVSLKGAGWKQTSLSKGGSWDCPSRPREDKAPTVPKRLWEAPT
jgi:hypothetical protein